MRGYQLLIIFGLINYCCCDSKIVEHLEKQLNNLIKKRNNGKPLIINGKMKKYRCIEEYIPVDEYGSIIEKEPLKLTSPSSLTDQTKGIKEAEPKGGGGYGYFTTTTTTTTLKPIPEELDSDAISPNGLNIQRIIHSPTPKYSEKVEKKNLHAEPRSLPVDSVPDGTEFVDEEPEIRRSSERRPSEFRRPPPPQREYDDYQYFESDRDYLGPEYYSRSSRIPYYSSTRSRIPTRNSHIRGNPYETRRPIPYINSNEYADRQFYPPSQPRPLPRGRDDRWQSPISVNSLPPQRQQYVQSSRPLRPMISSTTSNNGRPRPPPPPPQHPFPTLSPHPLLASPPPRQRPLSRIPQQPQPNPLPQHLPHPQTVPPPTAATTLSPRKNLQMTPENCQKVKSFASNFGVKNPQTWVRQNCLFAQTFVPNTSCEDLATFVDSCYRHHFL